jgi:hypothetical protein
MGRGNAHKDIQWFASLALPGRIMSAFRLSARSPCQKAHLTRLVSLLVNAILLPSRKRDWTVTVHCVLPGTRLVPRGEKVRAAGVRGIRTGHHRLGARADRVLTFTRCRIGGSVNSSGPLESILRTDELLKRPLRPPDYEKENSALTALVSALADSPRAILQTLADKILEILDADSAGLSLLRKDGRRFY